MRKADVMYGLVKKNDGTYALTEFVHYGKGHLDGGHSGRYPWGSGKDAVTRDVDKYKKVRLNKNELKEYSPKSKALRLSSFGFGLTGIGLGIMLGGPSGGFTGGAIAGAISGGIDGVAKMRVAQKRKAESIDDFNRNIGEVLDKKLSDPTGYANLVKDSRVFISGSSKTQDPESPFYQKELPKPVRNMIDHCVINDAKILVGDAPGIDSQVQDYLKGLAYKNVRVYSPFEKPRYMANKRWDKKAVPGELAEKDKAMTLDADTGIAVVIKGGAEATRNNVKRLNEQNKTAVVYEIKPTV